MVVYVEFYIINNLLIDVIINKITLFSLAFKDNRLRQIITLLFQLFVSILVLYFDCNNILFKFFSILVFAFLIHKSKSIVDYLKLVLVFTLITVLLGGACYFILNINNPDFYKLTYSYKMTIVYIISLCIFFILKKMFREFYKTKKLLNYEKEISVFLNKNKYIMHAFYDSGNLLEYKNNSVVVINNKYKQLFIENGIHIINDYIIVESVNGVKLSQVFMLDMINIDGVLLENVYAIFNKNKMKYDLLLNTKFKGKEGDNV